MPPTSQTGPPAISATAASSGRSGSSGARATVAAGRWSARRDVIEAGPSRLAGPTPGGARGHPARQPGEGPERGRHAGGPVAGPPSGSGRSRSRSCASTSSRYGALRPSSSACRPWSTMRPRSSRTIRSGVRHRAEPVGDHEHGPPPHQRREAPVDQPLARRVELARRLVEDQDARVGQDRPRDGEPLPLPAAQADPALADERLVAVVHLLDELSRRAPPPPRALIAAGEASRAPYAMFSRDRPLEQEHVLLDHGDEPPVATGGRSSGCRSRRARRRPRSGRGSAR